MVAQLEILLILEMYDGLIQCAYYQPKCNYLNIGSGQGITIKELVVS